MEIKTNPLTSQSSGTLSIFIKKLIWTKWIIL